MDSHVRRFGAQLCLGGSDFLLHLPAHLPGERAGCPFAEGAGGAESKLGRKWLMETA